MSSSGDKADDDEAFGHYNRPWGKVQCPHVRPGRYDICGLKPEIMSQNWSRAALYVWKEEVLDYYDPDRRPQVPAGLRLTWMSQAAMKRGAASSQEVPVEEVQRRNRQAHQQRQKDAAAAGGDYGSQHAGQERQTLEDVHPPVQHRQSAVQWYGISGCPASDDGWRQAHQQPLAGHAEDLSWQAYHGGDGEEQWQHQDVQCQAHDGGARLQSGAQGHGEYDHHGGDGEEEWQHEDGWCRVHQKPLDGGAWLQSGAQGPGEDDYHGGAAEQWQHEDGWWPHHHADEEQRQEWQEHVQGQEQDGSRQGEVQEGPEFYNALRKALKVHGVPESPNLLDQDSQQRAEQDGQQHAEPVEELQKISQRHVEENKHQVPLVVDPPARAKRGVVVPPPAAAHAKGSLDPELLQLQDKEKEDEQEPDVKDEHIKDSEEEHIKDSDEDVAKGYWLWIPPMPLSRGSNVFVEVPVPLVPSQPALVPCPPSEPPPARLLAESFLSGNPLPDGKTIATCLAYEAKRARETCPAGGADDDGGEAPDTKRHCANMHE